MDCKEFLETLNYDHKKPVDVIRVITETLNSELAAPEQKLFVIGTILDKNKENYIRDLKHEIYRLKGKIEKMNKESVQTAVPKKKVIVVKKKVQ